MRPKNFKTGESMRTHGDRGQKRFDIILPGIGTKDDRIRKSYGRTQREHDAFKQLLYDLHGAGNLEAIRFWLGGKLSGAQLLQLKRDKQLEQSPAEITKGRPLFIRNDAGELILGDVLEEAFGKMTCGHSTLTGYRQMWELLMRSGELPENATLRTLLAVRWGEWHRDRWPYSEDYWNSLRAAVSQVLTRLFGKYNQFRLDVMALIPQVEIIGRMPDLTRQDYEAIIEKVPPELPECYQSILILGSRLDEFCTLEDPRDLRPPVLISRNDRGEEVWSPGFVRFPKSKTPAGYREIPVDRELWPIIVNGVQVRMSVASYNRLERWWARACDLAGYSRYVDVVKGGKKRRIRQAPRIHDLRHSISQWALDEGVELTALMKYLGHKTVHQTVKYGDRRLRRQVSDAVGRVMRPKLKVS